MKKIIKLTESDLNRIVRRIIKESVTSESHPNEQEIKKGKMTGCYTVNEGDQLLKIAKSFGITLDDILKLNGLTNSSIKPGQKLRVKNSTKFEGC